MLFRSALLKSGPEWRSEGTALYYAFNFDQFALPLGKALLGFPGLLKALTFASWFLELLGGFILLIPHPVAKLLGVLLFAGLQAGIGATLALGHNPWVNGVVLLPFLPGWIWNRRVDRPKIEIIYDGDCGFCRKMVLILVEFLRPALIESPKAAQGKDLAVLRRENSWIIRTESGTDSCRFEAFAQLVSSSSFVFWMAPLLRSKPLHSAGTAAYRFVAGHRGPLGKLLSIFRFRPVRLQTVWWREALAVFFLVAVVIYNATWIVKIPRLADFLDPPILGARLEQYWGMFAPAPNKDDGWFVIEGRLRNGSRVEAFRGTRTVSYDKPKSAADFYPGERWRRYMINIGAKSYAGYRPPFAHYLCGIWNERNTGQDHLEQVSVFFMRETTPPPGQQGDLQKLLFFDYACPP